MGDEKFISSGHEYTLERNTLCNFAVEKAVYNSPISPLILSSGLCLNYKVVQLGVPTAQSLQLSY